MYQTPTLIGVVVFSSKKKFLEHLTPKFSSHKFGTKIEGSSPPSIFIGKMGYPKVFVGPLVTEQKGDTMYMDTPEEWLGAGMNAMDISSLRMNLARGMKMVKITDLDNKVVAQMKDIALASRSLDADAEFLKQPRGYTFNEHHQPFGPSAPLKSIEIENVRLEHNMEKAHYDTDLNARGAIVKLYEKGLLVSHIQKAFSVGAFGVQKRRKLVPTRWSITAVDDTLGKNLLDEVKGYTVIDNYQVYEFSAMNNYFAILLTPNSWEYEFLETFLGVFGKDMMFSDWEPYGGRTEYAGMGGCYYSTRLSIAEKLNSMKKQAGAIVFRESYPNYVPLGVWLVRETSRGALNREAKMFNDMKSALDYISSRLKLPFWKYKKQSVLLKQSTLANFC